MQISSRFTIAIHIFACIDTFEKDGVKKAFIQSEIPSLSFAQKFYESLGFKPMRCGQLPHSQIEKNKDVVKCIEDLYDYDVVPMLGKSKDLNMKKEEIFYKFKRTSENAPSMKLEEIFNDI